MWLLVHGFGTWDGGKGTFSSLVSLLEQYKVDYQHVSYPFNFTLNTEEAIEAILKIAQPGCKILAHSNGCTAAYECAFLHDLWIKHLIMAAPPLDPGLMFPATIEAVDICWNRGDRIVDPANVWRTLNDVVLNRKRTVVAFGTMGRKGPMGTSKRIQGHPFHKTVRHSGYFQGVHAKRILGLMEPQLRGELLI